MNWNPRALARIAVLICAAACAFACGAKSSPRGEAGFAEVATGAEEKISVEEKISGQGEYRFRVKYGENHLPVPAKRWLRGVHGGFAIDRRPGRGEVYFAIAGAGIVRLSGDLKSSSMIATTDAIKMHPMHNTSVWYAEANAEGDAARLIFPSVETEQVFTTDLQGKVLHTLAKPPIGTEFSDYAITHYFEENGEFIPTDAVHLRGRYYIPTGYSDLDYVLTADVHDDVHGGGHAGGHVDAQWSPLGFGGRGGGPGQFWTGHGITIGPGEDQLSVTDRLNSEIDRFTTEGEYLGTVKFPTGSQPCDVDYAHGLAVVGCLTGPDPEKSAPIYIMKDDEIVSTILPKDELGLKRFKHVHNAVLHQVGGRLYILALSWAPGDFAVLEQVID